MQAIERQHQILSALAAASASGWSVRALSSELGLPVSSTHRFLRGLASVGMAVQRRETNTYHLGHEVLRLASSYLEKIGMPDLVLPYLERLTRTTGLMTFCSAREGDRVVCTGVRAPDETTNFYVRIGKPMPLHATSAAKALIYALPPERLQAIVGDSALHRYTNKTISTFAGLQADLERGRQLGFWECDEELEPDVYAASAPILDGNGEPTISLTTLCHLSRGRDDLDELRRVLVSITSEASRAIGPLLLASRLVEMP